jgi:transposase
VKNPKTGKRVARVNPKAQWETAGVPELRIIEDDLWERAKVRQQATGFEMRRDVHGDALNRAHRRRFLFSGLLKCGECGAGYTIIGKNRYGCAGRRSKGICSNNNTSGVEFRLVGDSHWGRVMIQGWRRRFAMPPSRIALREDYDAEELRGLARRSRDNRQTRRLLALAAVYDGMSREAAASVGGMDRQTLRDWAHRFNAEGPDGLMDRRRSGMPRRLNEAQMRELAEIVETGPDPAVEGVVRWRRIDLRRVIEERFGVVYSERAITDLLKALSFSYISGRPQHPGQDARVVAAFKKTSR